MKSFLLLITGGVVLAGSAREAFAQSVSLDASVLAGGGGPSTDGLYAVSGTIGQPDASGALTGGNFSLTGGFWSLVGTSGAPLLTIRLTPTNSMVVSWPSFSAGFVLQQNANLGTANWAAPSEAVTDNGTNKFIIVSPPSGSRFYRLTRP